MEEGYSEKRLAGFRKFLNGFVGEKDSPLIQDDPIQFRGSTVGSFRLPASDVPAEILDWVLLYLHQRSCPQELAWVLAREVQSRVEALLPTIAPPITNGGTTDADSPDEPQYLLDSSLLYGEMLSQLHQVCHQLNNSEAELMTKASAFKSPHYQTSLVAVKNVRRKMEDRHVIIPDLNALCGLVDGPAQSYYAVFDGHSGAEAANFCSAHLHWNFVQHPKFECDPKTALREAFATTENQFEQRSTREGIKSGCTAICCLIRDKTFYLAWLGDSQAILVKKGMPITVMAPHKPERSDEKERVEKMGGCVMHVGTWRVNGILAVSRALGDFEHKPCVSSEPDIIQMSLDGDEDFLVVACDGLWDTLTPNDVTAAVYHYINQDIDNIDDIAGQVAQQAIDRGSTDNVTVIIVFLRDLKSLAAQSAVTSFSSDSFVNHTSNPFDSALDSRGLVFENGEHSFGTQHQEGFFHLHGGLMPEQTSISELPTPPIEDLINAEGKCLQTDHKPSGMNPFETENDPEVHDSHAKEIASAILNSALESATQVDDLVQMQGFGESDNTHAFTMDSAFFSGQVEVNAPLEVVAESGNTIEAPKPWVLQVQPSNQLDEVDYLPTGGQLVSETTGPVPGEYVCDKTIPFDPFSSLQGQDSNPPVQNPDGLLSDIPPVSEELEKAVQLDLESGNPQGLEIVSLEGEVPATSQNDVPVEQDVAVEAPEPSAPPVPKHVEQEPSDLQELSPELLKEAQLELEDVQSKLLQSVQQLSDLHMLSDDSMQSDEQRELGFEQEITTTQPDLGFHQSNFDYECATLTRTNKANDDGFHVQVLAENRVTSTVFTEFEEQSSFTRQEIQGEYGFGSVLQGNLQDLNPFGQPGQTQDMFGFAEETPSTIRPIHGVPEMIGFSEVVPGSQTSEPLVAQEPYMTSQKEVLAAFEDILVPSSPDKPPATNVSDLLQFSATSEGAEVQEVPESPEQVQRMLETLPTPPTEVPEVETVKEKTPVSDVHAINSTVPVQNNLLVDFIAPQMSVPELADPEAVANLLASDVPPTPEVVLEKIPDGVPEADGVTEDSDSEKDGGWSYVSAKGKEPEGKENKTQKAKAADSTTATTTATTATTTGKKTTTTKEPVKATSKTATMKPVDKLKSKPTASKPAAQPTSTMVRKTPTDPVKKPATSTMRPKAPSGTATAKAPMPASKTSARPGAAVTASKEAEVKTSTTKTGTVSRPSSTLTKRTTSTSKAQTPTTTTTDGASKSSPTTTATKTLAKRPSTSTAAARPAVPSTTTTRPTSTLNRPVTKTTTAAPRPASATAATLPKKPPASATSKTNTAGVASSKVPPARTSAGTVARTQKTTEIKQTKETANKQLVNQPGTLKSKQATASTTTNKMTTKTTTSTLAKSSNRTATTVKTTKTVAASGKTITKVASKDENKESPTVDKEEPTKPEPEKGSLEEKGKDNQAVDSGLASPESPVSPQLSLVNGTHQGDAPNEEKTTAVLEQTELN